MKIDRQRWQRVKDGHGASKVKKIAQLILCRKDNCYNPNNKDFHLYGARGIDVCVEWKNDTLSFVEWCLSNGYDEELQLDRIDNNKGYSPSNCRFVTNRQNSLNRRLIRSNNSSGYTGVVFKKTTQKWVASITIKGKRHYIGTYDSIFEAVIQRNLYIQEMGLESDYAIQIASFVV